MASESIEVVHHVGTERPFCECLNSKRSFSALKEGMGEALSIHPWTNGLFDYPAVF